MVGEVEEAGADGAGEDDDRGAVVDQPCVLSTEALNEQAYRNKVNVVQ